MRIILLGLASMGIVGCTSLEADPIQTTASPFPDYSWHEADLDRSNATYVGKWHIPIGQSRVIIEARSDVDARICLSAKSVAPDPTIIITSHRGATNEVKNFGCAIVSANSSIIVERAPGSPPVDYSGSYEIR